MSDSLSYDIFISYNSKDKVTVRRLAERLRADGLHVWWDQWEIRPGDSIPLKIEQGLEQSRALVLVMSEYAFASEWVTLERQTALFRDPMNTQRRFIPMLIQNCKFPSTIAQFKYIDYRKKTARAYKELLDVCKPESESEIFSVSDSTSTFGILPSFPTLVVGRDTEISELKKHLFSSRPARKKVQSITIIRGWPGVGKTTLAAKFAHEPEIADYFPDGVLWTSLGSAPNIESQLTKWARSVGIDKRANYKDIEELSGLIASLIRNKHVLLIIDDVWQEKHALPFLIGGRTCATLITTRIKKVADALAPTPNDILKLRVLRESDALKLLNFLSPLVVKKYPRESLELVKALEGLPLAIQVAGRLLNAEANLGWGVKDLLKELREDSRQIMESDIPADTRSLLSETAPTVAALLRRSTDHLEPLIRDRYAFLGSFASRPATFSLEDMIAIWQISDPKPTVRILIQRGLLEAVGKSRFQIHALLVAHARSLLT
ncbi:MAG: TIR domain-containing protein [Anaerolineales bacterium]|nr:TIR domain-containing protein [Anaerolineales bacterium]